MAVSQTKTYAAGEILTASDLNSSLTNITDNGEDLGFPRTKSSDFDGNELILDSDGDTSITSDSDDRIDVKIGGTDSILLGLDSTNSDGVYTFDGRAVSATAATNVARFLVKSTNAITIPTGTTAIAAGLWIAEPNLTATGTITTAATVYIPAAPTEGGTNYALWVDAGNVQFDGDLIVSGSTTISSGTITGITDITVSDGGTGASTLTDGGVLLGSGTGAITAMSVLADSELIVGNGTTDPVAESGSTLRTSIGVPEQAAQSAIEAETNEDTYLPPDLVKHNPGVAKLKGSVSFSGGTPTLDSNTNVTSITDNGVGDVTITVATDFSDALYTAIANADSTLAYDAKVNARAVGSFVVLTKDSGTATATDIDFSFAAWGDQ